MRAPLLFLIGFAVCGCSTPATTPDGVDDVVDSTVVPAIDAPDAGSAADAGGATGQDAATAPSNGSAFASQSVPSSVKAGASFEMSVTMKNTGTTTWSLASSRGHYLGSQSPSDNSTWGTNRVFMESGVSVGPGGSYTFRRSVKAPSKPGSYKMQWQMLQDGVEWFGPITPVVDVTVQKVGPPAGSTPLQIITYYRNLYGSPMTDAELIACLRSIAIELNAAGIAGGPFGMLVKTAGRNCAGYSCDIICSGQGAQQRQWDVLVDHEVSANPVWSEVTNVAVRPCEIL